MKISRIIAYVVLLAFIFSLPTIVRGNGYYIHVLILCVVNVILASSLRAITTTGQISLGHAGFMSVGAYTCAILVMKLGFSAYAGMVLGGLVAALLAIIIAFPVTRVKTLYLAMLTLFLGVFISLGLTEFRSVTGGTSGIIGIPALNKISILGINIDFATRAANFYFISIVMLIVLVFLYSLDQSYVGKTFKAIAQDEALASSTGINVTKYKVAIFCIGCFIAGVAGGFDAHYLTVITPDSFGIFPSIYIIIYVIVGGPNRFAGAIIGAVVLTIVPEAFRAFKEYQPLFFVAVLYLVVFLLPGGLVTIPQYLRFSLRNIFKGRAAHAGD
ncbi:MAG: ABC-type branched-chain amino acid transport system, permease component [Chloroflexi bacterium]|nr:ABC-type branched-chain amino acid transport system, permease component [Chloroflexota bacterium]